MTHSAVCVAYFFHERSLLLLLGQVSTGEVVIGWICSRDLFEISWECLHKVLHIGIAEDSRMFVCVCFHCLSGIVIVTLNRFYGMRTYMLDAGDHGELFWSSFG